MSHTRRLALSVLAATALLAGLAIACTPGGNGTSVTATVAAQQATIEAQAARIRALEATVAAAPKAAPVVATGNPTPAPAPAPAAGATPGATATPAPGAAQEYEVKSGDTLSSIATQFGVTVQQIVDANQITDANLITVGQKLKIPARA